MSRFFSDKYASLTPYTPGEQPRDEQYIKLHTNESPFPPSPLAQSYAREEAEKLALYSDPTCAALTTKAAEVLGVDADEAPGIDGLFARLAASTPHPLLAAGGITSLSDLRVLERAGVAGAVLGMSLYTGAIDAAAALQEFKERA